MHGAAHAEKVPTKALLSEFDRWHRLTHDGVPAVIRGGKDATLIASLYRSHGEELVRQLMADFFESRDPFIQQAGHSVGVFVSQAAKLIAKRYRAQRLTYDWWEDCKAKHEGKCSDRYRHELKVSAETDA